MKQSPSNIFWRREVARIVTEVDKNFRMTGDPRNGFFRVTCRDYEPREFHTTKLEDAVSVMEEMLKFQREDKPLTYDSIVALLNPLGLNPLLTQLQFDQEVRSFWPWVPEDLHQEKNLQRLVSCFAMKLSFGAGGNYNVDIVANSPEAIARVTNRITEAYAQQGFIVTPQEERWKVALPKSIEKYWRAVAQPSHLGSFAGELLPKRREPESRHLPRLWGNYQGDGLGTTKAALVLAKDCLKHGDYSLFMGGSYGRSRLIVHDPEWKK